MLALCCAKLAPSASNSCILNLNSSLYTVLSASWRIKIVIQCRTSTTRMKKFVVFDINGTLVKGSIGIDFVNWLHKKGHFPQSQLNKINRAVEEHKKGRISYVKRGEIIIPQWELGLRGKKEDEIGMFAREFIKKYKKVYPGSVELVRFFKKAGYITIAIGRTHELLLNVLNYKLNVDKMIGTKFEVRNGTFAGTRSQLWFLESKGTKLLELIYGEEYDKPGSVAFGDSMLDAFMMKQVEYPICLHPTPKLRHAAKKNDWWIFDDTQKVLKQLKKGKIIPLTSWYKHYKRKYKKVVMDKNMFKLVLKNDKPYLKIINKYLEQNSNILQLGSGIGRTASTLSLAGHHVTAIDPDQELLKVAKVNTKKFGKNVVLKKLNFFNIHEEFHKNQFDAIAHHGILEHYSKKTIKVLLDIQLYLAPLVIFSVPIYSKRNIKYFQQDTLGHRNLWAPIKWKKTLQGYTIKEFFTTKQRTDNLIVVLARK